MAHELASIDISRNAPSLADLVAEVERTRKPREIRRSDEVVAVLSPAKKLVKRSSFKKKTQADIEAMLSAAGGWADEDTDTLKANMYESRRLSTRPRPAL